MAEREWFEKDYYKVLGVAATATEKDITRAYRKLAKELHPDTNPGSEDRFKEISVAYDVLGDAAKRKEYDEVRRLGPSAAGFGGGPGGAPFNFQQGDFTNIGDLFGDLGGLFGQRRTRAQRGADLETSLHLNFVDAVKGVTTSVVVPTNEACRSCRGRGAASGGYETCANCQGRGTINDDQGPFAMSSMCPTCHGRGGKVTVPCANCHGTGREPSSRKVNVRIPAGVTDGQRIRLKGKGGPGVNGGHAGDLLVDVHVAAHPHFGRRGRHVTTTVPVPLTQAILGTTLEVATLDEPVTLKVPAGTQPGTTMRVRGHGVPAGGKHAAGDLLVTINVQLPTKLNKEQRNLVEKLATALREEAVS
jgi:molecular chaperone DnaJ